MERRPTAPLYELKRAPGAALFGSPENSEQMRSNRNATLGLCDEFGSMILEGVVRRAGGLAVEVWQRQVGGR